MFSSGVLRSMSRSFGAEAHSQVGEGHVGVYGIDEDWRRRRVVEKARVARGVSALGSRANAIFLVEDLWDVECFLCLEK